jgi:hypothetical protein
MKTRRSRMWMRLRHLGANGARPKRLQTMLKRRGGWRGGLKACLSISISFAKGRFGVRLQQL